MTNSIMKLVRDNIRELKPYTAARHEYSGNAAVLLDANESAYGEYNRYPDPLQWQLKFQLARIKGVPAENIFIGNGSDEVIDLACRVFCEPGRDNVIICPPTYGMYEVCANINNVAIKKVLLTKDFQPDMPAIWNAVDENTRLLFICSPNNPTGNTLNRQDVLQLLSSFKGIVIIDEAYINFSAQKSFTEALTTFPNLIIMQTLSKAWGMAGLRLGLAFASMDIIDVFNKVKPPYNISQLSQETALFKLQDTAVVNELTRMTVAERNRLSLLLRGLAIVEKVYDSDANFLLVKFKDAGKVYEYLTGNKIVVRNRSKEPLCDHCLRITTGTASENNQLINLLKQYNG